MFGGRSGASVMDTVAAVSMTLASLVLVWAALSIQRPKVADFRPYKPGEIVGELPELARLHLPESGGLVMWLQSGCVYCEKSLPFYRRLIADPQRRAKLIVVGRESEEVIRKYLADNDLTADLVVSVSDRDLRLQGTPTLVLLSQRMVVRSVWIGLLQSQEKENEVIVALH
jgi:hypothetical protein